MFFLNLIFGWDLMNCAANSFLHSDAKYSSLGQDDPKEI